MIPVQYWTFNKQTNSTTRPAVAGQTWDCEIKGECDILSPILLLNINPAINPVFYNYCYIAQWARYYFINDWVYVDGLWEAHLTVDVLASFRDSLRNTRQYILRSGAVGDSNVMDTLYPLTTDQTINISNISITYPSDWGEVNKIFRPYSSDHPGTYIIGVIGRAGTHGMVNYYAMDITAFIQFASYLYSTPDYLDISATEISEGLQKALVNPLQYITSLLWFPLDYSFLTSHVAATTTSVHFGWWRWDSSGYNVAQVAGDIQIQADMPISVHPQTVGHGGYLNKKPYSYRKLYIYPFGEYELPDICADYGNGTLKVFIDLATGQAKLQVYSGNNTTIPVITSYCAYGVNMPLAQVTSDVLGAGISVLQGITGAATAFGQGLTGTATNIATGNIGGAIATAIGGVAGAATQAVTGIASAIQEAAPTVQKTGSTGTRIDYQQTSPGAYIESTFYNTVGTDPAHRGLPYCATGLIDNFKGYLLIADPHTIGVQGTANERDMIAEFMRTGFYNED